MSEKPELKISVTKDGVPYYAHWDGMGWPLPDLTDGETDSVQWKLRYAQEHLTKSEALTAAAIIVAYYELIMLPSSRRNKVAGVLKNLTKLWHKQLAS